MKLQIFSFVLTFSLFLLNLILFILYGEVVSLVAALIIAPMSVYIFYVTLETRKLEKMSQEIREQMRRYS